MAAGGPAAWAVTVNPADSSIAINDGAAIDGTVADMQSAFSKEIATSQTGTGTVALGDIPVVGGFFVFTFDAQETGGATALDITDITLSVGGGIRWDYDQVTHGPIQLMGDTASPSGNGADLALLVPVALFLNQGFLGTDLLTVTWTQANDDGGFDEWVTVGDGFYGDRPLVTPIPAALPLFLSGLAVFGFVARRCRTAAVV